MQNKSLFSNVSSLKLSDTESDIITHPAGIKISIVKKHRIINKIYPSKGIDKITSTGIKAIDIDCNINENDIKEL